MKTFYSPDYVASGVEFATTRKAGVVAELLSTHPGVELVAPDCVDETAQLIEDTHIRGYVRAVQTGKPRKLAESQGFKWDKQLWTFAVAHNAGMVAATRAAREDGAAATLSSGLHHARADRGEGFCTFNGIAMAVTDAFTRGARRVLVLDLDAHCGGGTWSWWNHSPNVVLADLATNAFDTYAGPCVHYVDDPDDYMDGLEVVLSFADDAADNGYDLVIYNAGVDVVDDGVTGDQVAARDDMVHEWVNGRWPVAVTLAGGYESDEYTLDDIAALHAHTVATFAN